MEKAEKEKVQPQRWPTIANKHQREAVADSHAVRCRLGSKTACQVPHPKTTSSTTLPGCFPIKLCHPSTLQHQLFPHHVPRSHKYVKRGPHPPQTSQPFPTHQIPSLDTFTLNSFLHAASYLRATTAQSDSAIQCPPPQNRMPAPQTRLVCCLPTPHKPTPLAPPRPIPTCQRPRPTTENVARLCARSHRTQKLK